MKRRVLGFLSAALLAGSVGMLAPSSPASAGAVCAGAGDAVITPGLLYPVVGTYTVANFAFSTNVGTCVPGLTPLRAAGTVQGWCGHSTGVGSDDAGHDFVWTSVGTKLIITGEVTGEATAIPDTLSGQSCLTGATLFKVVGTVTRINCLTPWTLTTSLTTTDLPAPLGDAGVHTRAHACAGLPLLV